jgi:hypothetical protein
MSIDFNVNHISYRFYCDKLVSINKNNNLIIESSYNNIEFKTNNQDIEFNNNTSFNYGINMKGGDLSDILTLTGKKLNVDTLFLEDTFNSRNNIDDYNSLENGYIRATSIGYYPNNRENDTGRSNAYFTYINVSGGDSSFNDSLYIENNLDVSNITTISNDLIVNGKSFVTLYNDINNYMSTSLYSAKIVTNDLSATNISISNDLYVNQLSNLNNISISGILENSVLKVPALFTIDPSYNNSGTLIINGDLNVKGITTALESNIVNTRAHAITMASNLINRLYLSSANAGLDISNIASLKYNGTDWNFTGGDLYIQNEKVCLDASLLETKLATETSYSTLIANIDPSFSNLKINMDNSFNATYTKAQTDSSFVLNSVFDASLNYLNSSYVSKIQFDSSFSNLQMSYLSNIVTNILTYPIIYRKLGETITNLTGETGDLLLLGSSVAINDEGNIIACCSQGASRIYKYNDISWVKISPDIGEACAVALNSNGNIVAISNRLFSFSSGIIKVYRYVIDNSWVQISQTITLGTADDALSLNSSGNILAIGSRYDNTTGFYSGATRVYKYITDGSWIQLGQTIVGETAHSYGGYSVSLNSSGTIVAIGASYDNNAGGIYSGQVRIYRFTNDVSWIQISQDIDGTTADDNFGYSVSLNSDGTLVACGAMADPRTGYVKVYNYISDGSWIPQGQTINGEANNNWFGVSVSLNKQGNILGIGAPYNDGSANNAGHVRVYKYNDVSWTQIDTDFDGNAANDQFGTSIALNGLGNRFVVGAPYGSSGSGYVKVYESSFNILILDYSILDVSLELLNYKLNSKLDQQYISKSDYDISYNSLNTQLGNSLNNVGIFNLDTSFISVKAINTKHYTQRFNNILWNQIGLDISNIVPTIDSSNNKGIAISNDGKVVAVSSCTFDLANATHVGIVYVYTISYNEISYNELSYNWLPLGNTIVGVSGDELGYSLALSSNGKIVAASSLYNDSSGNNSGQVKVFELSNNLWSPRGNVINGKPIINYQSGYSINLSGNGNIISISSFKGSSDLSYGEVRVYELSTNNIWIQKGSDICGTVIGESHGFSSSLSLDGLTLALGSNVGFNNNIGKVNVYRFTTNWNNIGTISGPQLYLANNDNYSYTQLGPLIGRPFYDPSYLITVNTTEQNIALNGDGTIFAHSMTDSYGLIRVFKYRTSDASWIQLGQTLRGSSEPGNIQYIGTTYETGFMNISNDGYRISIGMNFDNASQVYGARIYSYNGSSWSIIGDISGIENGVTVMGIRHGHALSGDGNTIALWNIYTNYINQASNMMGQVRVYRYQGSGTNWTRLGDDISGTSTPALILWLGAGLAISSDGNTILATTQSYPQGGSQGIARVFKYSDFTNNWNIIGEFYGPGTDVTTWAQFGYGYGGSVISGDGQTVAVTTYNAGIYIFKYNSVSGTWQSAIVALDQAFSYIKLSYDGNTLVTSNQEIYIYRLSVWKKLTGPSLINSSNLKKIALSGDGRTFAYSYYDNITAPINNGSVIVYKINTSYSGLEYSENLTYSTNKASYINLFFGRNIKLSSDGNKIVIGATGPTINGLDPTLNSMYLYNQGSVYTYTYTGTGTTWTQLGQIIHGISGGDEFGSSISMSNDGSTISVGGRLSADNNSRCTIRVFKNINNYWTQLGQSINGKVNNSIIAYNHALSGDGTTLFHNLGNYSRVYGINKTLSLISPNTTISGNLLVLGNTILNSLDISRNHIYTSTGYNYKMFDSSLDTAIMKEYYSDVTSTRNLKLQFTGNGYVCNRNNSYESMSDSRLKENIVDSAPKLEDLLKVRVVNYKLKGSDPTKYIGVLAQELEELFPNLVTELEPSPKDIQDGNTIKYKAVNYSSFDVILIKALQEQNAIINNITKRIEALEKD